MFQKDKKNSKYIVGKNSVLDAINNNIHIKKIFATRHYEDILKNTNITYEILDKTNLDLISSSNHQGIIAEISDYFNYYTLEKIIKDCPPIILILDHIEDINNLGSILRTSNAAGVFYIIIPDKRAANINDTVLKISSGGFVNMKICKISSIQVAIDKLKKNNYWIYSSYLSKEAKVYHDVNYNFPMALVVGNESKGISSTIKKSSDELIYIPMKGTVQSLNVSVATGILLFDAVKKGTQ